MCCVLHVFPVLTYVVVDGKAKLKDGKSCHIQIVTRQEKCAEVDEKQVLIAFGLV